MLKDFFLWVSGVDKNILAYCEDYVETKFYFLGAFVLIPTSLAFVSMSYALSSVSSLSQKPFYFFTGGILWALIIFLIDSFFATIINENTKKNILAFFLRFIISMLLSLVISHPLTLMLFNDSIKTQLVNDLNEQKRNLREEIINGKQKITDNEKIKELERKKTCYEALVVNERNGTKSSFECTFQEGIFETSSGKAGDSTFTNEMKEKAEEAKADLESTINELKQIHVVPYEKQLEEIDANFSYDIISKQNAFDKMKDSIPYAGSMQFILMAILVILDLLVLFFKLLTKQTLYEKIILDTDHILNDLETSKRKEYLQLMYDTYHSTSNTSVNKQIEIKQKKIISIQNIKNFENEYEIKNFTMLIGVFFGIFYCFSLSLPTITNTININSNIFIIDFIQKFSEKIQDMNNSEIIASSALGSIILSIFSNFITDFIKYLNEMIVFPLLKKLRIVKPLDNNEDNKSSSIIVKTFVHAIVFFILIIMCISFGLIIF